MYQNNFKLFILGLACIVNINSFAGIASTFKDRQWEFLEYKFITKPQETIGKWEIGLAISWFTGVVSSTFMLEKMEEKIKGFDYNIGIGLFAFGYPFAGIFAINYYKKHLWYNAFKQLVAKWPKYKQYTPEEFHEALDELYEQYGQDPETLPKKRAVKLVKIMREAVMNKNPKKYYNKIVAAPSSPQMFNSPPRWCIHTGIR